MYTRTPSLAELELRLAKLERQNRRWKHLGLLFLLIAGSGFLLAQVPRKPPSAAPAPATPAAAYDTLVVHRLELRDKAGELRGVWTATGEITGLGLYDTAGKVRAALRVLAEGPTLGLFDAAGKPRAVLAETADGSVLQFLDPAGKPRVSLALLADDPVLTLYDADGRRRATLRVDAKGPVLLLSDAHGHRRASLAVAQISDSPLISTPAVTLFGKDGKVIWRAP